LVLALSTFFRLSALRAYMRSKVYETALCPSVCLSVRPIIRSQPQRAAALLLSAVPAGDVDRQRQRPGARQQRRHSMGRSRALSSKCKQ